MASILAPVAARAASTQTIRFQSGWNLVSFNVDPKCACLGTSCGTCPQGSTNTVSSILGPIATPGTLQALWSYENGGWRAYLPAGGTAASGVDTIAPSEQVRTGRGYWVKVSATVNLTIVGSGTPPAGPVGLGPQWNLVGFPVDAAKPRGDVIDILEGIEEAWTFDATQGTFKGVVFAGGTPTLQEFTQVEPGRGYWLKFGTSGPANGLPILGTSLPGDVDVGPFLDECGPTIKPGSSVPWCNLSTGDENFGRTELFGVTDADSGTFETQEAQRHLSFGAEGESRALSIFNAPRGTGANAMRGGILTWTAAIRGRTDGDPTPAWLRFETLTEEGPVRSTIEQGSIAGEGAALRLVVDRTTLGAGTQHVARVVITSNGDPAIGTPYEPDRQIFVHVAVPDLGGDYEVRAEIDTINGIPADTANPRLFLSIYDDEYVGRRRLGAVIDAERTLLFPSDVQMTGLVYEPNTSNFIVSGSTKLAAGDADNPYGGTLRRDVTLVGTRRPQVAEEIGDPDARLGPLDLRGEYVETVRGVLNFPIIMRGTFTAKRISSVPSGSAGDDESNSQLGAVPDPAGNHGDCGTAGTPLVREINVADADRLRITDVEVTVDIAHTRPTDLKIQLFSPSHPTMPVTLRDVGNDGPAGRRTYPTETEPADGRSALDAFDGELNRVLDGSGAPIPWRLEITDQCAGESGTFQFWSLKFRGTPVRDIRGTVKDAVGGAPFDQATVLLSGCGVVLSAVTGADGRYSFKDLIACQYRVAATAAGKLTASTLVDLANTDFVASDLLLADPPPGTPPPRNPNVTVPARRPDCTTACASLTQLSTNASAGLRMQRGGEMLPPFAYQYANDSATWDLDREPRDDTPPRVAGAEDTDVFQATLDPARGSNACVLRVSEADYHCTATGDGTIDGPASGSANSVRALVAIGTPVIGESVAAQGPAGAETTVRLIAGVEP